MDNDDKASCLSPTNDKRTYTVTHMNVVLINKSRSSVQSLALSAVTPLSALVMRIYVLDKNQSSRPSCWCCCVPITLLLVVVVVVVDKFWSVAPCLNKSSMNCSTIAYRDMFPSNHDCWSRLAYPCASWSVAFLYAVNKPIWLCIHASIYIRT